MSIESSEVVIFGSRVLNSTQQTVIVSDFRKSLWDSMIQNSCVASGRLSTSKFWRVGSDGIVRKESQSTKVVGRIFYIVRVRDLRWDCLREGSNMESSTDVRIVGVFARLKMSSSNITGVASVFGGRMSSSSSHCSSQSTYDGNRQMAMCP